MFNLQRKDTTITVLDILLVIVIVTIIGSVVYFFVINTQQVLPVPANDQTAKNVPSPAVPSTNLYAVLAPATVPSRATECSTQITIASDGNSGPVTCNGGDLNTQEWTALATLEPSVLTLGYNASFAQVQSALCADVKNTQSDANTDNAALIEQTAYQIAALYYGWVFPTDPSAILTQGTC